MNITTVLFDLDGTLLPMELEEFTKGYFGLLAGKMSSHGYDAKEFVDAILAGIAAMVRNDGTRSNEDVFWEKFSEIVGEASLSDRPVFDEFYENDFHKAKAFCGFDPKASETIKKIKEMGLRTVLATNPIFPKMATESRIRWAGLEPSDFELITAYENSRFCKPNPAYYREILSELNVQPEECLMVGNDTTEDMIAETLGMKVFLLPACLVNRENKDIDQYPHGGFEQLLSYLKTLNQ